ncbi:pheromone-regulated protein prm10, partial [Coemansia sp. RSA 2052]
MADSSAYSRDSQDNRQSMQASATQPASTCEGSGAEMQQAQHTPDASDQNMRRNMPEPRAAPHANGDSLERDLSRVAAWMQKDARLELGTHPNRAQRPLQIRLDVAAVERDTDMITPQAGLTADQPPGLLSHYLQLADIDQQRERLGERQHAADSNSGAATRKVDGSIRQHVRSALLRSRIARSKDGKTSESGSSASSVASGVVRPGPVQLRHPTKQQQQQEVSLGNFPRTTPSDARHNCEQHPAIDMQSSKLCFLDESPDASTSVADDGPKQSPPLALPLASTRPTPRQQQRYNSPNLRVPFSETDLTQFLPYALSTPGVQTAIGSPTLSRANSTDDFADWLKRNGRTLDATAPSPADGATDAEAFMLSEKRARLLEGIHKLLLHQRFLCRLAQAMMQFGAPLHHLEDNLSRMARHLCITATFTTMPGLVLISVEDAATFTSETKIIRCPNGYDMHRLELTDRIFRIVSKDKISVEEATRELDDVFAAEPLFAWYWQLLNWGLASWSVCILAFNGSWLDSLAAFVLGIMAGCLNLLASRLKGFTNLFEVTVSILTGFFTTVFGRWLCFGAVTLSATVVLLPGLMLTTGIIELTSRNMHAGTIRTAYALAIAFIIAFGLNLGNDIF